MSYVAFPPQTPDIFGPIITGRDVRLALDTTIQSWAPTYLPDLANLSGLTITGFGSWEAQYQNRALPAGEQVACWSTCAGTDPKHPPLRQGDGTYSAVWLAQSNLVVYGKDWAEAADLMAVYMAAVRAAAVQHGSLGGFATSTRWIGETTKEMEHQATRTVQGGIVLFGILVDGAVNALAGPKTLPSGPPVAPGTSAGPTVDEVSVTVEKEASS